MTLVDAEHWLDYLQRNPPEHRLRLLQLNAYLTVHNGKPLDVGGPRPTRHARSDKEKLADFQLAGGLFGGKREPMPDWVRDGILWAEKMKREKLKIDD